MDKAESRHRARSHFRGGRRSHVYVRRSRAELPGVQLDRGIRDAILNGTLAGTLSGSALAWKMDVPAGVSTQPTCTVTVDGTSTLAADGLTLNGSYSGTGFCASAFTNGIVNLTKQ